MKSRPYVFADTVINIILISVVCIVGNNYIKSNLIPDDYYYSKELSFWFTVINVCILFFLMVISVIINFIQYEKYSEKLNCDKYKYITVNIFISFIPFVLPFVLRY